MSAKLLSCARNISTIHRRESLPLSRPAYVLGILSKTYAGTENGDQTSLPDFPQRSLRLPPADAQNPRLSARAKRTIYSVEIAADLRALFFIRSDEVVSFDIGTHDIYRQ